MSDAVTELPGADIGTENYAALVAHVAKAERLGKDFAESLDSLLTVLSVVSAFLIIVGIALLEKSYFRYASMHNLIIKQLIIIAVGLLSWCAIGYTIVFGNGESPNKFMGTTNLLSFGLWDEPQKLRLLVYEGLCSVLPSSLMNACFGERAHLKGVVLSTALLGGVIYPLGARMMRRDLSFELSDNSGTNWFGHPPYYDYGNTLVHALGGSAGWWGIILIQSRWARNLQEYATLSEDLSRWSKADSGDNSLQCVATFFLLSGWTFFTVGGPHSFHDEASAYQAVRAAVNLVLAASSAGLMWQLLSQMCFCGAQAPDLGVFCSAMRAGLVAMTAPAAIYSPVGACLMGVVIACIYTFHWTVLNFMVDEVGGFASSHCVPAVIGLFSVPFGDTDMVRTNGIDFSFNMLWAVLFGCYAAFTTGVMFILMECIGWLKVPGKDQRLAYDLALQKPPHTGQPPPTTVGRPAGSR